MMMSTAAAAGERVNDWFEEWFGEEYLWAYPQRDVRDAQRAADLIESHVRLPRGAPALDLACGSGRHQRILCERWWTVGLDLSPSMLRVARGRDGDAPLVRADMRRLPFRADSFDLVVNLFTSFGYFRDDAQHQRVVAEVARVTRPRGWLVLDYLNAAHVRATLVPHSERVVRDREIEEERLVTADGRFVVKTITLGDLGRTYVERVRLFTPMELTAMLDSGGFAVTQTYGDYDGGVLRDDSPRAILISRRTS